MTGYVGYFVAAADTTSVYGSVLNPAKLYL